MRLLATQSKPADPQAVIPVAGRAHFPVWLLVVLLALVTMVLYWPATRHDFINYDDDVYVTANAHVQAGLTLENLNWAFTNPVCSNWHPLTMLSHMLDSQLFGLKPWGHHLTSVLLHTVNTLLVFLFLRGITGALWRSALVAALFGWHPLHVESVAWVAERKDVLSTCFGLLSLIFYARYARNRSQVESHEPSAPDLPAPGLRPVALGYGLALFFFALGLMSKPMLVTWPLVMLLLDFWPLERFKPGRVRLLVMEKIPFVVLAMMASGVTFVVQQQEDSVATVKILPLNARLGNALISYCRYLGNLFWPTDLAVFYPHPGYWPLEWVLPAGGLVFGISVLSFMLRRRYPFLLMGWFWYCGTLVPVIGLVQVGSQAMADRYMYIPSLGVLILAIWGSYELTRRWRGWVIALSIVGLAAIVLCLDLTRLQLGYWQDSETLFRHALAVTDKNDVAHETLGNALYLKGQLDQAIDQYQEAIRLKPRDALAYYTLGIVLGKKGQTDLAIHQFQKSVHLKPDYADAHYCLGIALHKNDQIDEAISQFRETIRLKPDFADAHYNLGISLHKKGQIDGAISQFQETIRLKPDFADAHYNLGIIFGKQSQTDEAIWQFQETVRLKPDFANAHDALGTALAINGQMNEAISQFQEAIRLRPDFAEAQGNLARALKIKNAAAGK